MKKIKSILAFGAMALMAVGCSYNSGDIERELESGEYHELNPEIYRYFYDQSSSDGEGTRSQIFRVEDKLIIGIVPRAVDPSVTYYSPTGNNNYAPYMCHVDTVDGNPQLSTAYWTACGEGGPIVLSESYAYIYAFYPTQFWDDESEFFRDVTGRTPEGNWYYSVSDDRPLDRVYSAMPSTMTIPDPVRVRDLNGKAATAATPQWLYPNAQQYDWMWGVKNDDYKNKSSYNHPKANLDNFKVSLYMRHAQAMIRIIIYKDTYVDKTNNLNGAVEYAYFGDISKVAPPTGTVAAENDTKFFMTGDVYFYYKDGTFKCDDGKTTSCLKWDFETTTDGTSSGTPYTQDMQEKIDTLTTFIVPTSCESGICKIGISVDGKYHTTRAVSTTSWEAGKVYTYKVNIGNQPLEIEDAGVEISDWTFVATENLGVD